MTHPAHCARQAQIADVVALFPERSTQGNGLKETVQVQSLSQVAHRECHFPFWAGSFLAQVSALVLGLSCNALQIGFS